MPACFVLAGMVAIWRLSRRGGTTSSRALAAAAGAVGWAAQRARPARLVTDVLRRGAAVGEGDPALPQGLSRVGGATPDRVGRDLELYRRRAAELADVPIEVIPYTASLPEVTATSATRDGTAPVVFVGRLVERKGVAYLIEAIARLGPLGPPLEIVGDGPERPGWRRWPSGSRRESGGVSREGPADDLQASYARAVACVLPSVLDSRGDTEGLGVVLLER